MNERDSCNRMRRNARLHSCEHLLLHASNAYARRGADRSPQDLSRSAWDDRDVSSTPSRPANAVKRVCVCACDWVSSCVRACACVRVCACMRVRTHAFGTVGSTTRAGGREAPASMSASRASVRTTKPTQATPRSPWRKHTGGIGALSETAARGLMARRSRGILGAATPLAHMACTHIHAHARTIPKRVHASGCTDNPKGYTRTRTYAHACARARARACTH